MQYVPEKRQLDSVVQDVAGEVVSSMRRWRAFADQLNTIPDATLTAIGYDQTAVAYLRSFQSALHNIELKYRNQAPLNGDDASYFVSQMNRLLVS